MMGDVINLNRYRKDKLAAERERRANEKRVFLKRAGEAGEQSYPMTADFAVLPGDTIRFGERYF